MSSYDTEQEQIEAIKKWWKENGTAVVFGLAIGTAALVGWNMWSDHTRNQQESASMAYQQLMTALASAENDAVLKRAERLKSDHADSAYAVLGAMAAAKANFDKSDLEAAKRELQWALDHSDDVSMQHIIRLRLARLMIATGKNDEALSLLEKVSNRSGFAAGYDELKGDVYIATGKIDLARTAYKKALTEDANSANSRFVQMKLDDLGSGDNS